MEYNYKIIYLQAFELTRQKFSPLYSDRSPCLWHVGVPQIWMQKNEFSKQMHFCFTISNETTLEGRSFPGRIVAVAHLSPLDLWLIQCSVAWWQHSDRFSRPKPYKPKGRLNGKTNLNLSFSCPTFFKPFLCIAQFCEHRRKNLFIVWAEKCLLKHPFYQMKSAKNFIWVDEW